MISGVVLSDNDVIEENVHILTLFWQAEGFLYIYFKVLLEARRCNSSRSLIVCELKGFTNDSTRVA